MHGGGIALAQDGLHMRLALLVSGVTACVLHPCGPAHAETVSVSRDLESVPDMPGNRRASDSAVRMTSGDGSARAVSPGRSRDTLTASDAVSVLCPSHGALAPLFQAAAERYRVRTVVLVAMARVESNCDPRAVNRRTQSYGLLQIKLDGSANPENLSAAALQEPEANVSAAARHLRRWTLVCGSLAGGLAVFHGRQRCAQHSGDGYVAKVLGLVTWAKRTIAKLQKVRS